MFNLGHYRGGLPWILKCLLRVNLRSQAARPDGQSLEADIVRLHAQVSFVPISEGGRAILRRDGLESIEDSVS